MKTAHEWVFHDPRWWIDQIAIACSPDLAEPQFSWQVDDYFTGLKDRLAGTLRYLSGRRDLKPYDVRRSLFFAKAMKKWRLDVPGLTPTDRANKALDGFVARNERAGGDEFIPKYTECMRKILNHWLPYVGGEDQHGKFGPGAVAEHWCHPQRYEKLREWTHLLPAWETATYGHADVDADVCRLCAVPKDWDKDRLITVEPCVLSFQEQRGRTILLESIHSGPLRGTAMDLGYSDGQAIQRRLALEASRTGARATIDLSDASDSVSWAAVQAAFPQWVVDLLWGCRSFRYSSSRLPEGCHPHLKMYAGMGNATTFVVETLFFSAYAVAVQACTGCKKPWVSTFGDDIIVSSEACERLLDEGSQPFFQINRSKSFLGNDALRESCGIFAYLGEDVTVPKVDGYSPTWYGACGVSDLHRRLAQSGDLFQVSLARAIAETQVLDNWPFLVDGYPSISDWSAEFSALPKTRWNTEYQRREVAIRDVAVKSVRYPCSDAWVDEELDPDILGPDCREIDRCYARGKYPPAETWLYASLLGCVHTQPHSILRKEDADRFAPSYVSFPTESCKVRRRWAVCLPSGSEGLTRSKSSKDVDRDEGIWDKALRKANFDITCLRRHTSPLT